MKLRLHAWPRSVSHSLNPKVQTGFPVPPDPPPRTGWDFMRRDAQGMLVSKAGPPRGPVSPQAGFTLLHLLWVTELLLFSCNLQDVETSSRTPHTSELDAWKGRMTDRPNVFQGYGELPWTLQTWSRSSEIQKCKMMSKGNFQS